MSVAHMERCETMLKVRAGGSLLIHLQHSRLPLCVRPYYRALLWLCIPQLDIRILFGSFESIAFHAISTR